MNNYDSTVKPTTKCGISHEPNEEDLTFTTRRRYGPCLGNMLSKCDVCLSKQSSSCFIKGRVDKLNC
ncbi:hypothetical protein CUMW_115860 [Citrus unshiu]|uniref:Uncharacterized protein n=1 Tax=Citrus unshiu TaxID=55188 RepID=A0A2H5P9E4_CITUN|nr:hypothetical protein CUMW_115860 [Citrus unshiu]